MKTIATLLIAALAPLFSITGHAETYEGVVQVRSTLSRAEVNAQAEATANAARQNIVAGSRVIEPVRSASDRATVRSATAQAQRDGQIQFGEATRL